MKKQRLIEIDILKGIAIILVVIGHVADGNSLGVEKWYLLLRNDIYQFHMPLFMFLSGLTFRYTYSPFNGIVKYRTYLVKKSLRILPPFIIFSFFIFLGKISLSNYMYVENFNYTNLFRSYLQLYLYPTDSFIGSYWYIYVLLEYLIIFPLLLKIFKQNTIPLLGIGIIIFFIPTSSIFALNMFVRNFIFFTFGIFIMTHYKTFLVIINRNSKWLISLFIISFILTFYLPLDFSRFFIGFLSLFAFYTLVQSFMANRPKLLLVKIGQYSFIIYLMNTIFIGIVKAILMKFDFAFIVIFIFSIFAGITLPILLKLFLFSKIKYLDRMTN